MGIGFFDDWAAVRNPHEITKYVLLGKIHKAGLARCARDGIIRFCGD